jgi:subtilisin family serine protease
MSFWRKTPTRSEPKPLVESFDASIHAGHIRRRRDALVLGILLAFAGASRADIDTPAGRGASLIVRYREQGAHAVETCVEGFESQGGSFLAHSRDGEDRLDRLHAALGTRRHRPIFRGDQSGSIEDAERRLRGRLARAARRHGKKTSGLKVSANGPALEALEQTELAHVYRVELAADQDPHEAARALNADPAVVFAQVDHVVRPDQSPAFDDPFLSSADSWGQGYADLWGLDRVRAREAWSSTLGEGALVAVVDTGLDFRHPDIEDNLWVNPGEDLDGDGFADPDDWNGVDDDGNGWIDDLIGFDFAGSIDADEDGFFDGPDGVSDSIPDDLLGHGTHVAGTAVAVAGNAEGIAGVAPRASVMALKAFTEAGTARSSDLWRAVLYAAEQGADVVNNSWSCGRPCPVNPLAESVLEIVNALGTTVVTSAGNAEDDVLFYAPENGDRVVTVGSIGFDDRRSSFSNRGWGLDVMAPGGGPSTTPGLLAPRRNILSLMPTAGIPGEGPFVVGERYRRLAGTSMSSPHVAGAVLLLRSRYPDLTPEQIRASLRVAARDVGAPGDDPGYGPGVLDLARLVVEQPPVRAQIEWVGIPPGALLDPAEAPHRFRVEALGPDVAALDLAVARGLVGRAFEAAASDPDWQLAAGVEPARTWIDVEADLEGWADGPWVLRARVTLNDGRLLDAYRIFAVERIAPRERGEGLLEVGAPALAGERVVWPVARSEEVGSELDLAVRTFAGRDRAGRRDEPYARIPMEGRMRDLVADEDLVAWRVRIDGRFRVAACRLSDPERDALKNRDPTCPPQIFDPGPGVFSPPEVGRGWILWQRDDGLRRNIEGCRSRRRARTDTALCAPRPLVALQEGGPRWRLRSFDGRRMLLQDGATLAFCDLHKGGAPCEPEPISWATRPLTVSAARHDGALVALQELSLAMVPPLGCLSVDPDPDCRPQLAVVERLLACEVEAAASVCDPVALTPFARLEAFGGFSVSADQIAWSLADPLEEPAIRVCAFDAEASACSAQRITGAPARQDAPVLRGEKAVWRGVRDAAPSIWAWSLPELSLPESSRVRAGRRVVIKGESSPGDGRRLRYEVELETPDGPDRAAFRVEDRGRSGGRIRLSGRVPEVDQGQKLTLRVRAETEAGLWRERRIRLEVRSRVESGD